MLQKFLQFLEDIEIFQDTWASTNRKLNTTALSLIKNDM